MKTLLTSLFVLLHVLLTAQEKPGLTVSYNLFENTILYYRNGEQIQSPEVKKGENIYVEVKEYNPYIHKVRLESNTLNYAQNSNQFAAGPSGGMGGSQFHGISQLLGGLNMGNDLQGTLMTLGSSRGKQSKEAIRLKSAYFDLTDELVDVEEDINDAYHQIKMLEHQSKSQNIAIKDIEELKKNALIKPSRIKEMIEEEVNYAFAKNDDSAIKLSDILEDNNKSEKIESALNAHSRATKRYTSLKDKWKKLSTDPILVAVSVTDPQLKTIKTSADSISNVMEARLKNQKEADLDKLKDQNSNQEAQLITLRRTYEELQNDIFTYKFPPIQSSGQSVGLNLVVKQLQENGDYTDVKSLNQNIEVTGDWKISGGLGLAFSTLKDQTYAYEVVDNTIVADPLDDFVPMFTSFIHGHKMTTRQVSIGTTFGIGFPLQSQDGNLSLSFFLGPSLILGKSEKLFFTAGVMGGKTERLSGGFRAGDFFNGISSSLPMRSKYELGYFLAFSYVII